MNNFLDYLCGKNSDYTIIRCQKVTKEELKNKLIESIMLDSKEKNLFTLKEYFYNYE